MLLATHTASRHEGPAREAFERRLAEAGHVEFTALVEAFQRGPRLHVDCRALDARGECCAGIRLSVDGDVAMAWIGDLHVAPSGRGAGVGTALAAAAEEIAQRRSAEAIGVFPLARSLGFWGRLGYRTHPRRSRVLIKQLPPQERNLTGRRGNQWT